MSTDVRCFFKPAGSNPEIVGPSYELISLITIVGHTNFEALSLVFREGQCIRKMVFRPIDPTKPIVIAAGAGSDSPRFIYIDHHIADGAAAGMYNFGAYRTDEYLIDCQAAMPHGAALYWSITSEGMTFVYGQVFPDTWEIRDCDLLCAFIAGELTANQLRAHAYLTEREEVKEERRQEVIEDLARRLHTARSTDVGLRQDLYQANDRYLRLVDKLRELTSGGSLLIRKSRVSQIIGERD